MKYEGRPTWAEINLNNLEYNFNSIRNFIGSGTKIMAVVKADAYGHGAVRCAQTLEMLGADWLGVALPEEALEIRRSGISLPILCLGSFWPGQEELLLDADITPVIFRIEQAGLLDRAAERRGTIAKVHVKFDTGMGRVGVRLGEAAAFADALRGLRSIRVEGLMTHFASADRLDESEFTYLQIKRFQHCVDTFRYRGFAPEILDMANSPASVAFPESRSNMVRVGGILYGLGDDVLPREIEGPDLRPVLSLWSRIAMLKDVDEGEPLGYGGTFVTKRRSKVATVPIGYHDGYPRILSNRSKVMINGAFAPVVGRISMDWTIVDVSDIADPKVGDAVVLIGSSGTLKVTPGELAGMADTISYEITCGIGSRVPRIYTHVE